MTDHVDCVVIGAGVIGLATARALALSGREVIVLEAEAAIGAQTSARNSEVIHAGINYPPGSLKARLCVAGKALLYPYCEERGVPARRIGKLVVACEDSELPLLDGVARQAEDNGVLDLVRLAGAQATQMEPELRCVGALFSPSTGIIDSHAYMLALWGDAERAGAVLAFKAPLLEGTIGGAGFTLSVGGAEPSVLDCDLLINAGGHQAPRLARSLAGLAPQWSPTPYLCKGSYFSLRGRAPFRHLIYPAVPSSAAGLGVHLTLDMAGQAKFGPDVEWIESPDVSVDPERAASFYPAIRRYWPGLRDGALDPAYAGLRPKISDRSQPPADFRIDGPDRHGIPGLVNLFGIESPGLTSSLAIAEHVVALIDGGDR